MRPWLRRHLRAEGDGQPESPLDWRRTILNAVVLALAGLGLLAYVAGVIGAVLDDLWWVVVIDTIALAFVLWLAISRRASHRLRAFGVLAVCIGLGLFFTYAYGPASAGPLWLFVVPLLAALVLERRKAAWTLAFVSCAIVLVGVIALLRDTPWTQDYPAGAMLAYAGSFIALCGLLTTGTAVLVQGLSSQHDALQAQMRRRTEAEAQLRQAQKMEAIGRLAGGMAHDFNNILTAIVSFAELARAGVADTEVAGDIDEILSAAEKAQTLNKQLLAFSRRSPVRPTTVDLNRLLQESQRMLSRLLGESYELVVRRVGGVAGVEIDPGAMQQVLLNLVLNARDAMPHGGRLVLETAQVELQIDHGPICGERPRPGPYVMLAVTDEGVGMEPETLAHAFEPFYTTKPEGRGTGLGLASCFGIVRQASGYIAAYSERGHGTTFKIYLPRADGPASAVFTPKTEPSALRGHEVILLTEDDAQVRAGTARILRDHGYTVVEASDGPLCLRRSAELEQAPELLVTDVIMPGMSGKDLADALVARYPDLRVLFVSGYTHNVIEDRGVLDEQTVLLEKPFSSVMLLTKVRELLDR